MRHSKAQNARGQRPVVQPPMILHPRRMRGVLMKVARRNMMVLSVQHATQASFCCH
jgi:hypothetical protein